LFGVAPAQPGLTLEQPRSEPSVTGVLLGFGLGVLGVCLGDRGASKVSPSVKLGGTRVRL